MPRGGEAGCRPRLGREVRKGLGAVGRGCRRCLAALLVSLEHLPLGLAQPLMLSVRPLGLAGIPSCQAGAWRSGWGLEMHTLSSWLVLLLLSSTLAHLGEAH